MSNVDPPVSWEEQQYLDMKHERDTLRDERDRLLEKQEQLFQYQCPKSQPSCLMCGKVEEFSIKHLALGSIGICKACVDERDRLRRLIEPLLKMTPERPNAITWENGVQIINYVQDILKAALTPAGGGKDGLSSIPQ